MDRKALSLPILISLVVGNVIGTGIYVLPATLAEYGTISLLAWIFTSIGALFLVLTFTQLTKRFPKTGGPYVYCKQAFGKLTGFIIAYIYWISIIVSVAALAVASIGYLGFITPLLDANSPAYSQSLALGLEIGVVWLFTLINLIGVHTAGVVQLVMTIIKLSPLLIICFVGFADIHVSNLLDFTAGSKSSIASISSAMTIIFWAFVGIEAATVPAENTKGYRDIYIASIAGVLIASGIYIVSTFVLMGMIPVTELKTSQFPFAQAGTILFNSGAAKIIALCAVISGLGSMNSCVMLQGQIVFAAARDHMFPRLFVKVSKHDAPVAGLILSSVLATLFLVLTVEPTLLKQFNNIALLAGLLTLLTYFATTLAELKFVMQSKRSRLKIFTSSTFLITIIAVLFSGWIITNFELKMLLISLLIILVCIPVYYFTVRHYVTAE